MQDKQHSLALVLLAAGSGTRYENRHKLLEPLNGIPVFIYALTRFLSLPKLKYCVIVTPPRAKNRYQRIVTDIAELLKHSNEQSQTVSAHRKRQRLSQTPLNFTICKRLSRFIATGGIHYTNGGSERCHSVHNGLKKLEALQPDIHYVLIHDGARPLIAPQDLRTLVTTLTRAKQNKLAIIPGVPPTDTIKQVSSGKRKSSTETITAELPRSELRAVSTPQCFPYKTLCTSYAQLEAAAQKRGFIPPTDDCAVYRRAGYPAAIVPLKYPNPKLTYKGDLELLAQLA